MDARRGVIGSTYLERGQPVVMLRRWAASAGNAVPDVVIWHRPPARSAPRNVLIRRADRSLVVRPFRGLRLPRPYPSSSGD